MLDSYSSWLNCHNLSKFKRQKLLNSSAFLRFFPVCKIVSHEVRAFRIVRALRLFRGKWVNWTTHTHAYTQICSTYTHIHPRTVYIHIYICYIVLWFNDYICTVHMHGKVRHPNMLLPSPPFALQHSSFTVFPTWKKHEQLYLFADFIHNFPSASGLRLLIKACSSFLPSLCCSV